MPYQFDVFLSHSSKDKDRVRRLADALIGKGLRVWLDEQNIKIGDDITQAVAKGLEQSRRIVLCLTPDFLQSQWAESESNTVLFGDPANKARRLIPILLVDCQLPQFLGKYKYLNYCDESAVAFAQLVEACQTNGHDPAPAPPQQRTFEDLRALAAYHPRILVTIERSRQELQTIADRIKRLTDLKELHDQLHDLQVVFYNQIQVAVNDPAERARKSLKLLGPRLATLLAAIKKLQAKQILPAEDFEWLVQLDEAKSLFDAFLKGVGAIESLEEVKIHLESILQVQPAMVNRTMLQLAGELNLGRLVEVMLTIQNSLQQLALKAEILDNLGARLAQLAELDRRLTTLIRKHNQWQALHNVLHPLDAATARLKQVAILWKQIWRITASLLSASQEGWTAVLREEGSQIEQALKQEDPPALVDHLKVFQAEAEERFYETDTELLEHCRNMDGVGDSLTLLLQV